MRACRFKGSSDGGTGGGGRGGLPGGYLHRGLVVVGCVCGDGWSHFCAPRCGESGWCARDKLPGRSRFDGDAHSAASA